LKHLGFYGLAAFKFDENTLIEVSIDNNLIYWRWIINSEWRKTGLTRKIFFRINSERIRFEEMYI